MQERLFKGRTQGLKDLAKFADEQERAKRRAEFAAKAGINTAASPAKNGKPPGR